MNLRPLDTPEVIRTVADWMARKENYRWLDFGTGKQVLTAEWLKILTQRDSEVLRVFTADEGGPPIGLVALSDVDRYSRTARIWTVLGEKTLRGQGHAARGASRLLTYGFRELGLHSVNTWIVEHNPSVHIAERLGFKLIGRQRQCHYMNERFYDRLWFDLLAPEHREI
ncbi:MAG: hypothetical protein DMF50_08620 [Acidobacteria bacterium]|nr:MAG: hypothetical protein DMF50_08620 [Acidobacteriota bacterium]